jgi:hypothetical protein
MGGDTRCHKTGCRDIGRERVRWQNEWTEDADTLDELAASVFSDFINEGSITDEQALSYLDCAPCVTLPYAEDSTPRTLDDGRETWR